jgi:hypothetical protein
MSNSLEYEPGIQSSDFAFTLKIAGKPYISVNRFMDKKLDFYLAFRSWSFAFHENRRFMDASLIALTRYGQMISCRSTNRVRGARSQKAEPRSPGLKAGIPK